MSDPGHLEANEKDLYTRMRALGGENARSNGYVSQWLFMRERRFLHQRLGRLPIDAVVVDVGSGSGLMMAGLSLAPILLDYDESACLAARQHGVVVRGDAHRLPLEPGSADVICNCQFLNQQPPENDETFLREMFQVLKPGGRLLLLWRNGRTLPHRVGHRLLGLVDPLGYRRFPQFEHAINELSDLAKGLGFQVKDRRQTLVVGPASVRPGSIIGFLAGASLFLELEK